MAALDPSWRRIVMSMCCKLLQQHCDHTFARFTIPVRWHMSSAEITKALKERECSKEFTGGPVKGFDTNNLPSNSPIEDRNCEARCLLSSGYLFGVFDGHGGESCSHAVSERIFKYIAATLLPQSVLERFMKNNNEELISPFSDHQKRISNNLKHVYDKSFVNFLTKLPDMKQSEDFTVEKSLEYAFVQLDSDMSNEALEYFENESIRKDILSVAKSGTVACVAHIDGPHLHIANLGDCCAVLGIMTENNDFVHEKLMFEHNYDNESEVTRILSEHPPGEKHTLFRMDRLLGNLAPLRALGDFKYKWSKIDIERIISPFVGYHSVPQNYYTPPYLSGKPEVFYHYLRPKDKFLIIASDGLWDIMTPTEVINIVGQHMLGKVYFTPFKLTEEVKTLGEIHKSLTEHRKGLMTKPIDENAATHLLRHALGGTEIGATQNEKLSIMLSLNPEFSRSIRDDITITHLKIRADLIIDEIWEYYDILQTLPIPYYT